MKALPDFKRGDSFALACVYKVDGIASSIVGKTITSQIRTNELALVATLTAIPDNQSVNPGHFRLVGPSTTSWPVAGLRCDIQIVEAGVIVSTDTFLVPIVQDITQ